MEFNFSEAFERNYNEGVKKLEEKLKSFIEENPEASATETITEIIPLTIGLSMGTTRKVLDDYHAALMEYLKK